MSSGGERIPQPTGGGMFYMVQAAFWFAVMALLVKLCGARGLPTMQIVLARAVVTLTLSTIGLVRARQHPWGNRTGLLIARGVFGSGGFICFYAAVNHLPLAEATVVHHISPVLTAVVAAVWLGERLEGRVLVGMALAFGGVLLIAQPTALFGGVGTDDVAWPYVLVGALGALFAAFAYASVRQLGRTEPPILVVFWFPAVSVPISLPFAIHDWVPPDLQGWLLLGGVGAATQIAQLALTKGLARERAGRATSVGYLQIAFAALFGLLLFGDVPGPWSWAGMALIVGSLFVARRR
ncbi:MAG: DMT family transporter [Planctomycetes bacterium]|nr:DMT family transporter [Planctomycetota bacterium]